MIAICITSSVVRTYCAACVSVRQSTVQVSPNLNECAYTSLSVPLIFKSAVVTGGENPGNPHRSAKSRRPMRPRRLRCQTSARMYVHACLAARYSNQPSAVSERITSGLSRRHLNGAIFHRSRLAHDAVSLDQTPHQSSCASVRL